MINVQTRNHHYYTLCYLNRQTHLGCFTSKCFGYDRFDNFNWNPWDWELSHHHLGCFDLCTVWPSSVCHCTLISVHFPSLGDVSPLSLISSYSHLCPCSFLSFNQGNVTFRNYQRKWLISEELLRKQADLNKHFNPFNNVTFNTKVSTYTKYENEVW